MNETESTENLEKAIRGERHALARTITQIELGNIHTLRALDQAKIRRRLGPGKPHVVGVTGPPGAGKSTFLDGWISCGRKAGHRIAVVAVDPSSPFSGGAILGDRIRMEGHTEDLEVYIRSLSTRGYGGGLSRATVDVVDFLDACGFDEIIVETVGIGQSELGVMSVADSVIVLLTPESGDTIQTMKAGVMEIADLFVVNKSDRPGAHLMIGALEREVELVQDSGFPMTVHEVSSLNRVGIQAVYDRIGAHRDWCCGKGKEQWRRRRGEGAVQHYLNLVSETARVSALSSLDPDLKAKLSSLALSPRTALEGT